MVANLARNPHIQFAELDQLVAPSATVSDPGFSSEWHLPTISAPAAWDMSVGSGVTIAILDTGVDGSHPDLAGHIVPGWNFYDNNSNTSDVYGHGTAVAGACGHGQWHWRGGRCRQATSCRSASPSSGYASWSTAQGLTWAADHGALPISLQRGRQRDGHQCRQLFRSKGRVVAVSARTPVIPALPPLRCSWFCDRCRDGFASFSSWKLGEYLGAGGKHLRRQMAAAIVTPGTSFSSRSLRGSGSGSVATADHASWVDAVLKSTATGWVLAVSISTSARAGECLRRGPDGCDFGNRRFDATDGPLLRRRAVRLAAPLPYR
jgi:hypothetical protein